MKELLRYGRLTGWVLLLCLWWPGGVQAARDGALDAPAFSHPGGFYRERLALVLSHPDQEARIYYTLDGSEPDPGRLGGVSYEYRNTYAVEPGGKAGPMLRGQFRSHRYGGPLTIAPDVRQPERLARIATSLSQVEPAYLPVLGAAPRFPRGIMVRTVAVKGQVASPVATQTYFFGDAASIRLPIVSLAGQEDHLFGYERGVLVPGKAFDDWRRDNPAELLKRGGKAPANWYRKHDDIPAHVEYFIPVEGSTWQTVLNQAIGLRVHGGTTRATPNKSMRLYARKEYGAAWFKHDFFGNGLRHKRLVLRNSGSDSVSTLFRDAVIQEIADSLNFEKQRYRPVVVFLNGEYRGLYNLREYEDERYLAEKYGIDDKQIDLMENDEAEHGDDTHWRELVRLLEGDIASAKVYAEVRKRMDVDSFIDYQAANIYIGNSDWPHNNVRRWRHRAPLDPARPPGADGRWRWMMYDVDFGMQSPQRNVLDGAADPKGTRGWKGVEWSTLVLRRLLLNREFRERFQARFETLMEREFSPDNVIAHIDRAQERIRGEVPRHIERWKTHASVRAWEDEVESMRRFARQRPAVQRDQLRVFFGQWRP